MKWSQSILFFLTLFTLSTAIALPASFESWTDATKELFKRKGGGGGGGRGGSGGSSSSSSGGKGGSSSSSSTSSPSSSGSRGYGGGGQYYGGGAATSYRTGSAQRGVTPYLLGGAALGVFPGLWLYGAYAYSWPGNYYWRNATTGQNETGPVDCWCSAKAQAMCGCDQNNDTDYLTSVANNASIAHRLDNGTLLVNGTLDDAATDTSAASSLRQGLMEHSGYWIVVAGVTYAVSFL